MFNIKVTKIYAVSVLNFLLSITISIKYLIIVLSILMLFNCSIIELQSKEEK